MLLIDRQHGHQHRRVVVPGTAVKQGAAQANGLAQSRSQQCVLRRTQYELDEALVLVAGCLFLFPCLCAKRLAQLQVIASFSGIPLIDALEIGGPREGLSYQGAADEHFGGFVVQAGCLHWCHRSQGDQPCADEPVASLNERHGIRGFVTRATVPEVLAVAGSLRAPNEREVHDVVSPR